MVRAALLLIFCAFFFSASVPAQAGLLSYCAKLLSGDSPSARARQKGLLELDLALTGQASTLTQLTGRHLSATQAAVAKLSESIDQYLLMGDTAPLDTLCQGPVRTAELAFLQRVQNLDIISTLTPMESFSKASMEKLGLLQDTAEGAELELNKTSFLVWKKRKLAELAAENKEFEKTLGSQFEDYRRIRNDLASHTSGSYEHLMTQIANADNRLAPSAAMESTRSMLESVAAPVPGAQFMSYLAEQKAKVETLKAQRASDIDQMNTWWDAARGTSAIDVPQLISFLKRTHSLGDATRTILAKDLTEPASRLALAAELELARNRLVDASSFLELAHELDETLGLQPTDFETLSYLIPEQAVRPSVDAIEKVVQTSSVALAARKRRARWKAIWAFIDGNVLYGNVGALIPALGRGAENIRLPSVRNFIYFLFKDLYQQHAENHYFPSLSILRKTPGDTHKRRRVMENLNAGTKDELLVVFARRSDLSALWQTIRRDAERDKDQDHQKLFDRMVVAEKKALELGPISPVGGSSYARYLIAGAMNGTILYFASKWWLLPGAQWAWERVTNHQDSPTLFTRIASFFQIPEAMAALAPPRPIELRGYNEEMEERILSNLEILIQALVNHNEKSIWPAAQELQTIEKHLSGKPPSQ